MYLVAVVVCSTEDSSGSSSSSKRKTENSIVEIYSSSDIKFFLIPLKSNSQSSTWLDGLVP